MATPKPNANQIDDVQYDNAVSGLSAVTMKAALDEIAANYLPNTGRTNLTSLIELGNTTNENAISLPTASNTATFTGGISASDKAELKLNAGGTANFSFDGGAAEYIFRQGGPTGSADVITKAQLDAATNNVIVSDITGITGADPINNIISLTQAEYDAIGSPDANTFYIITDSAANYDYISVACSDLTSNLNTGTSKGYFRMPYAGVIDEIRASVLTAPTGANIIIDINENGVSIYSTRLVIDAGDKTSVGSGTTPVLSDTALADDSEITIDIDQVGSTLTGKGLIVTFKLLKL